jgi:DNA polymerase III sliding clamp (beta) subunit (PCNA family)
VESVPVTLAGTDQVISFNPHYLIDGLAAAALTTAADSGRIRLEFTSPAKPALITSVPTAGAQPDFRYLVVPLRAPSAA